MSVTCTQGKLEVLRRHYEGLDMRMSVDDNFEADWKEEIASTLDTCSSLSEVRENDRLCRQLDRKEIAFERLNTVEKNSFMCSVEKSGHGRTSSTLCCI